MRRDGEGRALILTLYSGEGEFERCRRSVAAQDGVVVEHRVFEHLPNREAHDRLYRTITEERDRFDLFVKLDADMALADAGALGRMVAPFHKIDRLDHLVMGVDDWMTGTDMIGVHAFSPRVRWEDHDELLYVDPDPLYPGLKLVVAAPRPPVVDHCFDPTPMQAFHFGVHRALQASQRGRSWASSRPHNARLQMGVLDRLWRRFVALGDRRLGLAALAADMVIRGEIRARANDYHEPDLLARYREVEQLDAADILARLKPRWGSGVQRWRLLTSAPDPSVRTAIAVRLLRDAVTWPIRRVRQERPRRPRTRFR